MTTTLQHLPELWFGMGKILTEENWPEVSAKIKQLSLLIQNYAHRISSHAVRQSRLYITAEPARRVKNASHVEIINPLLLRLTLSDALFHLNTKLLHVDEYVQMKVNPFMEGFFTWQR
jgi:hypothetical protein